MRWLVMTSATVLAGISSSPGSSQSWPRSRSASYIGCGNFGYTMTRSSGSSGCPHQIRSRTIVRSRMPCAIVMRGSIAVRASARISGELHHAQRRRVGTGCAQVAMRSPAAARNTRASTLSTPAAAAPGARRGAAWLPSGGASRSLKSERAGTASISSRVNFSASRSSWRARRSVMAAAVLPAIARRIASRTRRQEQHHVTPATTATTARPDEAENTPTSTTASRSSAAIRMSQMRQRVSHGGSCLARARGVATAGEPADRRQRRRARAAARRGRMLTAVQTRSSRRAADRRRDAR